MSGEEDEFEEALGKTRPMKKRPSLMDIIRNGIPDSEVPVPHNSVPSISVMLGEFLWIIKPLVYLLAVSSRGEQSWWPLITSVCLDLWSWRLHEPSRNLTKMEKEELSKRVRQVALFYLFRSPISDKIFGKLSDKPQPNNWWFVSIIKEIIRLYRTRYYYTA